MPRPRFTLRVVLVVTAIAAVVAWQGGIVQRRKAAMTEGRAFISDVSFPGDPFPNRPSVNPLRSLLGDQPIRLVYVHPKDDWHKAERDVEHLKLLFPEAKVQIRKWHSD